MKRLLLVSVLVLATTVPATALAGGATMERGDSTLARGVLGWIGPVDAGGLVGFNVKKTNSGKRVKKFSWGKGVPMTCADGAQTTEGQFLFGMKVKQGEFKGAAVEKGGTAIAKVVGKFTSKKKAKGTLKVQGDVSGHDDCNTGKLPWKAIKGGGAM
jgi:hypothetical protein